MTSQQKAKKDTILKIRVNVLMKYIVVRSENSLKMTLP